MNKWLPIVAGIVVLTAILLVARFVSDSEFDARQTTPVTNPAAEMNPAIETVVEPPEAPPSGGGADFDRTEQQVIDAVAVKELSQDPMAGSVGRVEQDVAGSVSDTGGHDMPGLVMPGSSSTGSGTGPSQENFDLPGPETGGEVTSVGPRSTAPEVNPESPAPPVDTDSFDHGPSQLDLGLPGPGQEDSGLTEPSATGMGLVEAPEEDQALPSQ